MLQFPYLFSSYLPASGFGAKRVTQRYAGCRFFAHFRTGGKDVGLLVFCEATLF